MCLEQYKEQCKATTLCLPSYTTSDISTRDSRRSLIRRYLSKSKLRDKYSCSKFVFFLEIARMAYLGTSQATKLDVLQEMGLSYSLAETRRERIRANMFREDKPINKRPMLVEVDVTPPLPVSLSITRCESISVPSTLSYKKLSPPSLVNTSELPSNCKRIERYISHIERLQEQVHGLVQDLELQRDAYNSLLEQVGLASSYYPSSLSEYSNPYTIDKLMLPIHSRVQGLVDLIVEEETSSDGNTTQADMRICNLCNKSGSLSYIENAKRWSCQSCLECVMDKYPP